MNKGEQRQIDKTYQNEARRNKKKKTVRKTQTQREGTRYMGGIHLVIREKNWTKTTSMRGFKGNVGSQDC